MKKILISLLTIFTLNTSAQTIYLCQPTNYQEMAVSSLGNMTYSVSGSSVSIGGTSYYVNDIDSITFTRPAMTVKITYSDGYAKIDNNTGGLVRTIRNSSGHVALYSAASETGYAYKVNYIVNGSGSNNSLYIEGDYKLTLTLNGVTLTNPDSAAIRIRCGKLAEVELAEGTTNTLVDGTAKAHDACFWIKGHAEFSNSGTLNITGNYNHAFKSGEYCEVKKSCGTINILSAKGDGIHCGEHFQMNGGAVNINNTKGDGIDADSLGNVIIKGGAIDVTLDTVAGKGIKCDSTYTQSGGAVTIVVPSTMLSAKGISIGKNGFLVDGTITATLEANGSKGIKGDGNFTQSGGIITMAVNGGKDKLTDPTDPSKCYGIKLDGAWIKTGGTCNITLGANNVGAAIKDASNTYDGSGIIK